MSQDPFSQFLSGGLVAAKFPSVGYVVEGSVTGAVMKQQSEYEGGTPKVWSDGSPAMQMVVDMECAPTGETWETTRYIRKALPDDNGMRALYVKGNLQKALTQALRDANAKFEIGGRLRVERVADGPQKDKQRLPAYEFKCTWTAPSQNAVAADDFLATAPVADDNPFASKGGAPF
jgi:hypothetical protein